MLKLAFTGGFYVYNRRKCVAKCPPGYAVSDEQPVHCMKCNKFCFKSCHSKEISGAILPNSTNCTKVIGDIILPRGKGK